MSTTTLWNVLNNKVSNFELKRGINIPMIQRDYAQGRMNTKTIEIRKLFLNNILKAIEKTISEGQKPLELDFIYGYSESDFFIPLDGQQRLTTLYLLHWYFAFKEERLEEFKKPFSNFNYQTRQSSEEFLKSLVLKLKTNDHEKIFLKNESFEKVIKNKNWYFINWKHDLTIQSIIAMLDEIHLTFNNSSIKFDDLIDESKPCIVFNFLNIEKFGLSDDLYIKMNARGKPLNDFENLKAELGRFIKESDFNKKYKYEIKYTSGFSSVDVETYFITKIDTVWTDYFWRIRNTKTNTFDDKLLNLLAFISLNELARKNINLFDHSIKQLVNGGSDLSYYNFLTLKLLNEESIINYIEILDLLADGNQLVIDYLNDLSFLNKENIINKAFKADFTANYAQRIQFYAIFKFLLKTKNALNKTELNKWDRIVKNLVINTIYNKPQDYHDSLISIDKLIEGYNDDIYKTVLKENITGFDSQQVIEEKLKIELMCKGSKWEDFIALAESHKYLNGQIIPILVFSGIYDSYLNTPHSWSKNQEEEFYSSAVLNHQKITKLFNHSGLIDFKDKLFRRALLTKGDYLLYKSNWCLLINGIDRDVSWKRLLKETGNRSAKGDYFRKRSNYLQQLIEDIQIDDIESSLLNIVENHNCNDWRAVFIDNPILIKKSEEYRLKFFSNHDRVYVLRKLKYNKKADPEVYSILIKERLTKEGFEKDDIGLGFIEELNQYGITRIKGSKPKIVYNYDNNFIIRQKDKPDIISDDKEVIIDYILRNFK